jgi:O-antigen/teichoic acid export membrane protein
MSTRLATADPHDAYSPRSALGHLGCWIKSTWLESNSKRTGPSQTWALFDQAVVSATNFSTNLLVANYCLPRHFGIFYLAISLLYFVRGVQEQLISAPYTIFWHRRDPAKAATFTGSTLVHQVAVSAVTLISLLALSWVLGAHAESSDLASALTVLLIVVPFFLFREYIRKLLFAHFQFRAATILDVVVAVVQLSGILYLVSMDGLTVSGVFVCGAGASLVAAMVWYARFRLPIALDRQAVRRDWRENWSFGRWALMTHVLGCSVPYLMPWFIKFVRDEGITAMYAACQTLVGLGNMLLAGVSNYLSPKSAHAFTVGGTAQLWRVLMRAVILFVVTLGPFCVLLGLTGDSIPYWAFGDDYAGLGKPLFFLAIALLSTALGMTAGNGIWALARPALNMAADVACLVSSFGLAYVWVPQWGATGAAAAVMAGAIIAAAIRWVILLWLIESVRPTKKNDTWES